MKFSLQDLLFFKKFITPSVLTFIFWIAVIISVIAGIFTIISGGFIQGLIMIIGLPIYLRISFELLAVIFNINSNLQKIADSKDSEA